MSNTDEQNSIDNKVEETHPVEQTSSDPTEPLPSDKKSNDGLAAEAAPASSSEEPKKDESAAAEGDAVAEGEDAEPPRVTTGELFKFADGTDQFCMIFGSIVAFVNGASMPAFSEVFGRLVNKLSAGGANVEKEVADVALIMVYVGLVVFVLSAIQTMTWMIAAERQTNRIRRSYFSALLYQDVAFHDTHKPGELTSRLGGDTMVMKNSMNDKLATGIMNFGMFIFGFALGFYRSWELTLLMLGTLPFIAGISGVFQSILVSATQASREGFASAGDVADEVLSNVRTVQAFGQEEREVDRLAGELGKAGDAGIKKEFANVAGIGATYGILFCSYSAAFALSGYLIEEGRNNVGEIVATFFSVLMGSFGLGLAMPALAALGEAQAAAYKVYAVLDAQPAVDPRLGGETLDDFRGEIEFKDMSFVYPTRKDYKMFSGLNLKIEAGTTVAFSGASGCGKSSLISLLQRFYDPNEGEVLIDGKDLKTLDAGWWRDQIGIVSQEPNLFSGSVLDNIRLGRPDATLEEVEKACQQANIHDTIMSLPSQYETPVGAVGSQLSGGQKQRICIARAIVKNPSLLILDEATSALDRKSEAEVQAALDDIMRGDVKRTVVVIAHRLTTIRNADMIHYITHDDLEGSHVAESGTFDELMAQQGAFAAMASKQSKSLSKTEEAEQEEEQYEREHTMSQPGSALTPGVGKGGASFTQQPVSPGMGAVGTPGSPGQGQMSAFVDEEGKPLTLEEIAKKEVEETDVALSRLIAMAAGKQWSVAIALLGSLISGGVYPAYSVVFSKMLAVLGSGDTQKIRDETGFWAGMFSVIGVSAFLGWLLQGFYAIAGEEMTMKIRTLLFRSLLSQDMSFFDTPGRDAGSLTTLLSTDCEAVHMLWGPSIGFKVQTACNLLVGITIAFFYQWKLALVTIAAIPMMVVAGAVQQLMIVGFGAREGERPEDVIVGESLQNVRTVVAFNVAERKSESYAEASAESEGPGIRRGVISGIVFGFSQFTFYGVFALAFWYGGKLMQRGEATFEEVMIASMAVLMGAMGAGEAGGFAAKTAEAGPASQRVFAVIDKQPMFAASVMAPDDGNELLPSGGDTDIGDGASVEFDHVKFIYPARPDAKVLQNFNEQIGDRTSIGLMGSTGCGKSSVVALLQRFYDPTLGSVMVNGKDLRTLDLKEWRAQMSIIQQEPSLFAGTVRENIKYGKPDATDAEIEEMAKLAQIHDDVMAMPDGYETEVGYKGRMLSGGQKQRVAIARGLLRKPKMLLCDEMTSALDQATEAKVMEGIAQACQDHPMTIVSVAHRLTTIRYSDKIVLLDNGVVLESGTHDELMALDGDYKARWEMYQASIQ